MARRRFGATRHTPATVGDLLSLPGMKLLAVCELTLLVFGVMAVR